MPKLMTEMVPRRVRLEAVGSGFSHDMELTWFQCGFKTPLAAPGRPQH